MDWLPITIAAYFLIALGVIMDKFILSSKRVSHPAIFAFYSGLLSLLAFLFFPFGFHLVGWSQVFWSFFSGIIFTAGLVALFSALSKSEASQVTPAVGAIVPIITYFLSIFILEESLTYIQLLGVFTLILGGLIISLELKEKSGKKLFSGFALSIAAGIFLGVGFTLFKYLFERDNFINVYIWTRLGVISGALLLLVYSPWRKCIFNSLKNFQKPKKEQRRSGMLFILGKSFNGMGSIMLNFAISLGSVTLVNALIAVEYAFVFILGAGFSYWLPSIYQERKNFGIIVQKTLAILVITVGIILIS